MSPTEKRGDRIEREEVVEVAANLARPPHQRVKINLFARPLQNSVVRQQRTLDGGCARHLFLLTPLRHGLIGKAAESFRERRCLRPRVVQIIHYARCVGSSPKIGFVERLDKYKAIHALMRTQQVACAATDMADNTSDLTSVISRM